jgi:hypothetical protein
MDDVAKPAPMVGSIAFAVSDQTYSKARKFDRLPDRRSSLAFVLGLTNCFPIDSVEWDVRHLVISGHKITNAALRTTCGSVVAVQLRESQLAVAWNGINGESGLVQRFGTVNGPSDIPTSAGLHRQTVSTYLWVSLFTEASTSSADSSPA